jgi:hypothetical protein
MSTPGQVEQLRARARRLRSVSSKIGASRALVVHTLAGPDTWVGPTPQSCYDALLAVRRHLQKEQQTLIDTARAFERRADELEQQPPIPNIVS